MEEVADEEVVAFVLAIAFAHGVVDAWEDDEFEVLAGTDESIGNLHGAGWIDIVVEFTYDEQGRLKKIERTFWESSQEEEFFYEGDNPYPVRRRYQSSEEGMEAESETEYRYTKFDEQGNWTEREMRYRGDTTEGGETTTRWRGAMLERRTISYY